MIFKTQSMTGISLQGVLNETVYRVSRVSRVCVCKRVLRVCRVYTRMERCLQVQLRKP